MYTTGHRSAIKRNGILPPVTKWMDMEGIQPSAVSQRETYAFTSMWNLTKQMNKQNRNRLTDTENRRVAARGKRSEAMSETGEGDDEVQTSSYKTSESRR